MSSPSLTETEAFKVLLMLDEVDEDMQAVIDMGDPPDDFEDVWGAPYSVLSIKAIRQDYPGFISAAYIEDSSLKESISLEGLVDEFWNAEPGSSAEPTDATKTDEYLVDEDDDE